MKNETLNGVLTFILGVLVVLGVIFALRVVNVSHEMRQLETAAAIDNNKLNLAQAVLNETVAYNNKFKNPQLTSILNAVKVKTRNR
ncbi:MAG: hypothetical protein ACREFR_20030 [Limisphaerales bacterium]